MEQRASILVRFHKSRIVKTSKGEAGQGTETEIGRYLENQMR